LTKSDFLKKIHISNRSGSKKNLKKTPPREDIDLSNGAKINFFGPLLTEKSAMENRAENGQKRPFFACFLAISRPGHHEKILSLDILPI